MDTQSESRLIDPITLEAVGPRGARIDLPPQQYLLLSALARLPARGVLLWPDAVVLVYGAQARADWQSYVTALRAVLQRLNRQLALIGWEGNAVRAVRGHGLRLYVSKEYLSSYITESQSSTDGA